MENEQEKQVEEVKEAVEEVKQESQLPEVTKERPEENWKAELARKNAEIDRLRSQVDSVRHTEETRRDPADIRTWTDQELKMLKNSADPSVMAYKDQADEILLERKVRAIQARERNEERRIASDLELRSKYPEALDPSSEFSARLEHTLHEYDLSKTPAGRLVAAKIVAAELEKGANKSDVKARKNEQERVSRVKGQMVDGDRAKPTETGVSPADREALKNDLMDSKHEDKQVAAVSKILKDRGLTQENLFGKR